MYLQDLSYHRPSSPEEAIELLTRYGPSARLLSGGTDLMVQLRTGARRCAHIVDLKTVPGLNGYGPQGSAFHIGANVPMNDLDACPEVQRDYPALWQAIHTLADVQIRNRATIAGNLCNASPAADTAPPLMVYDAQLRCAGPAGERTVPIETFFSGPGETVLDPGEVLLEIQIPGAASSRGGSVFEKLTRTYDDIALLNAAARVEIAAGGRIEGARISLGAVAATPIRVRAAEDYLVGRTPSAQAMSEAGRLASQASSPISDVRATRAYRQEMSGVLVRRALEAAFRAAVS